MQGRAKNRRDSSVHSVNSSLQLLVLTSFARLIYISRSRLRALCGSGTRECSGRAESARSATEHVEVRLGCFRASVSLWFVLLVSVLWLSQPLCAQDFNWSWEEGKQPEEKRLAETKAPEPDEKDSGVPAFNWSWDKGSKEDGGQKTEDGGQKTVAGGIDLDEYNELLQENLKLRKDLKDVEQNQEQVRKEKDRLAKEVRDLEGRIGEFTTRIQDLKQQQETATKTEPSVDPDRVMDLETKLAAAEGEKARLANELVKLREQKPAAVKEPPPTPPSMLPMAGVQPGSDLFRQLEEENASLKRKLAEAQSAGEQASVEGETASSESERLSAELAAAQQSEQDAKNRLAELMKHIPSLEKDMGKLQVGMRKKDADIEAREQAIRSMKVELDRREQRLLKAEKIVELLEKTRTELQWRNNAEKRDMHYNMACYYSQESRNGEAEGEYLKALRIDPNDADTHYNLGILYEQGLKNVRRAAMHYRKYLRLRPNAEDVDQVRLWLLEMETSGQIN